MALTKAMSKDLGPDNIRVNTVCIGFDRSDQMEKMWKRVRTTINMGRIFKGSQIPDSIRKNGRHKEAAKVITFLVSDAASYETGTSVNIDWWF